MAEKYSFEFYVSFVTKVGHSCVLFKECYRVTEGTDDWKALMEPNSNVKKSLVLRSLLRHFLTTETTMEGAESYEAMKDSILFWSVPNIQDSYPGDERTLSDIFDQFKSLNSGEKTVRMTLLFVKF